METRIQATPSHVTGTGNHGTSQTMISNQEAYGNQDTTHKALVRVKTTGSAGKSVCGYGKEPFLMIMVCELRSGSRVSSTRSAVTQCNIPSDRDISDDDLVQQGSGATVLNNVAFNNNGQPVERRLARSRTSDIPPCCNNRGQQVCEQVMLQLDVGGRRPQWICSSVDLLKEEHMKVCADGKWRPNT